MSFAVDDRLQIASHEGLSAGRTEKRKQLQQITKKKYTISRRSNSTQNVWQGSQILLFPGIGKLELTYDMDALHFCCCNTKEY
jgi:hypothetical protein